MREFEDICERSKGVYEGCKGVCGRLREFEDICERGKGVMRGVGVFGRRNKGDL